LLEKNLEEAREIVPKSAPSKKDEEGKKSQV
jgi:hypothetical protein